MRAMREKIYVTYKLCIVTMSAAQVLDDFRIPSRWNDRSRAPTHLHSVPDIIYDMPGGALVWHKHSEVVLDVMTSATSPLIAFRTCNEPPVTAAHANKHASR